MMRRETVAKFSQARPFQPFELRLVDGQRFKVKSIEEFILGSDHVAVLDTDGIVIVLNMGLIAAIRPVSVRRRSG